MFGVSFAPRVAVLLAFVLGVLGYAQAAAASVPGANGKIAFRSWDGSTLMTIEADGTALAPIPNTTSSDDPTWSPDGTRLAFAGSMFAATAIYTINADGTDRRRLSPDPVTFDKPDWQPAWSPDGTKMVFTSRRADFQSDIYVMNAAGGGLRRLTTTVGLPESEPAWSPDGKRIAFVGVGQIFVMNADGSGQVRLTFNGGENYSPSWSPDGSRISFWSTAPDNGGIHVIGLDGSGDRLVAASGVDPAWSPDGTMIAFRATPSQEISLVNPDGTGRRSLGVRGMSLAWQTGRGPAPAAPPVVTGAARAGATLSVSAGSWWGPGPLAFSYQWQRCVAYPGSDGLDYGSVVVRSGPLGYWRLGEASGPVAADASGHGANGAYVGGVMLGTAGALSDDLERAALFDGSTGNVDVDGIANTAFASQFTLEAWVKVDAPQQDKGIAGKWKHRDGGGVLLWLNDSGNYALAVGSARWRYLQTPVAPTPGAWEHVVGTWDGRIIRLYRNGVQIGWRRFEARVGEPTVPFQIASYGVDRYRFRLRGAVDEVALYGRALAAAEVRAHYDSRTVGRCVDVPGATSAGYVLGARDVGAQLRAVVTASNSGGSATSRSELSAVVAP